MKRLLIGNEAIARGAYARGCLADACRVTPGAEIFENVGHDYFCSEAMMGKASYLKIGLTYPYPCPDEMFGKFVFRFIKPYIKQTPPRPPCCVPAALAEAYIIA